MKDLKELEKLVKKLNTKKKEIKAEIAKQTEMLQKQLTEVENEIKSINKDIKKINENRVNDKSVHILERFIIWNGLKHDKASWLIDRGPIRDTLFDEGDRHRTYSIVETLNVYLAEYVLNNFDEDDFPEIEDFYDFSLVSTEGIKFFNEKLGEVAQKELTELIENAIEMNIDEFTYDW